MRLEGDDELAAMVVARRRDRRAHRGRMMRVVVDERQRVRSRAKTSKRRRTPRNARSAAAMAANGTPELVADRHGGERVLNVHRAGHAQLDAAQRRVAGVRRRSASRNFRTRRLAARNARCEIEAEGHDPRAQIVRRQRGRERIVDADDREAVVGQLAEKLAEARARAREARRRW